MPIQHLIYNGLYTIYINHSLSGTLCLDNPICFLVVESTLSVDKLWTQTYNIILFNELCSSDNIGWYDSILSFFGPVLFSAIQILFVKIQAKQKTKEKLLRLTFKICDSYWVSGNSCSKFIYPGSLKNCNQNQRLKNNHD